MSLSHLAVLSIGSLALLSCQAELGATGATVHYLIDAPLCSSKLPVQFFIDAAEVGRDTFNVNIMPERTKSRGFTTTVGPHTLGARVVGGFVWPDRTPTLTTGQIFIDTLPFYCS